MKYKSIKNVVDAYYWVYEHPELNKIEYHPPRFEISPQYVNPKTKMIDDDKSKNTLVNWWIECSTYEYDKHSKFKSKIILAHDVRLDCDGDTIDEAFFELARLVYQYYGDY